MMTLMPDHPDHEDRHQRLEAIARLEQQHKVRRSHLEAEGQVDPSLPRSGKFFLLLISKGSGNLQQRANQDRAETMLNDLPHETIDGSNMALSAKRDELFGISDVRGNYPQLFLVDNGVISFIGGFDIIERHNDEGTLPNFVLEKPKSPRRKSSMVGKVKGLWNGGSKRDIDRTLDGSKLSDSTLDTKPMSQSSMGVTSRTSNRSMVPNLVASAASTVSQETAPLQPSSPTKKSREKKKSRSSMASMGGFMKSPKLLGEGSKPASTGNLMTSLSDGDLPLIDEDDKKDTKDKGEGRSRSKSRGKEGRRSSSKGKHSSQDGNVALNEEGASPSKSSKSSKSGRSRSTSAGKYKEKREKKEASEEKSEEKREGAKRDRSKSPRRPSRSRSHGRLLESLKSSKDEEGETDLKEEDGKKTRKSTLSRSKSRSNRGDGRTVDVEGKDERPKPRRSRSKGQLETKKEGDSVDKEVKGENPSKEKSRTKLRDKDAEKHPRRSGARSASPHKLREKTKRSDSTVRSTSPGKFRGDIARKREAMKEFREKKSARGVSDDGAGSGSSSKATRLRRHQSVKDMETSASSLMSPRRHQSLMNFNKKGKDKPSEHIDESLHELVMRVKEKDKKTHQGENDDEDLDAVPSVQW